TFADPLVAHGQHPLQPGDVLLVNGPGFVSDAIRIAERVRFGDNRDGHPTYSHAALYVGDGLVVEMLANGFVKRPLEASVNDNNYIVDVYRWKGITAQQQQAVAAWGRDYNKLQSGAPANARYAYEQAAFLEQATTSPDPVGL